MVPSLAPGTYLADGFFCRCPCRREVGLRDYLNAVLGHCNDDQCVLLSRFLHVNRHVRQFQKMDHHKTMSAVEQALAANRCELADHQACSSQTDRGRPAMTTGTPSLLCQIFFAKNLSVVLFLLVCPARSHSGGRSRPCSPHS
jgi:hypothetical protein